MAFASLNEFLGMGGHAPYVWAAWCVTAAMMLGAVIHAKVERRSLIRDLKRRERRVTRELSGKEVNES